MIHFVGFEEHSQRFQNAVLVFGPPAFVHRRWDMRAKFGGEFDPERDVYIFAKGTEHDTPTPYSFDDSSSYV